MGHGAQWGESERHGEIDVAGPGELALGPRAQLGTQDTQHLFLPRPGEAATRAIVGDFEVPQIGPLQLLNFGLQAGTPLQKIGHGMEVLERDFVDNGQHGDFKQNGVQPRPIDVDFELTRC